MSNLERDTMGTQLRSWRPIPPELVGQLKTAYGAVFEIFMWDVGDVKLDFHQEMATDKPYWSYTFTANGFRKPEFVDESSWFEYNLREYDNV